MPLYSTLIIAYLVLASIHTFSKRLDQAKRDGEDFGTLPDWVLIFSAAMYGVQIWMLVLDWKRALGVFAIAFILAVLPILEFIGNILLAPFNWFSKTRNTTLMRDEDKA